MVAWSCSCGRTHVSHKSQELHDNSSSPPVDPLWTRCGPAVDPLWTRCGPPVDPLWTLNRPSHAEPLEGWSVRCMTGP
eukprot:887064-Prorocentrum_minimum.AAC.1